MSFMNRFLVRKFDFDALLSVSTMIAMIATLLLSVLVKWDLGEVYSIIITIFVFFSMNGIIAASATAAALDGVPEIAGSASALIGSLQYGSGIISSVLLAWLADGTPWTMAWIITLFTMGSATMAFLSFKENEINEMTVSESDLT